MPCLQCLRVAAAIKEEDLTPGLIVNTDQTGINYAQGANISWAPRGSKQVPVVAQEEKRAFTMVVSVCADGTLLPFQAVYRGKTPASCPSAQAPKYNDALATGFQLIPSGRDNHWSTLNTMFQFVNSILAPFFNTQH